jgi:hypothetical protein
MNTYMTAQTPSSRNPTVRPKASSKTSKRLLRYFCATILLIVCMVALKGIITWLSEEFVYNLPILGGLLKSLELMEVTNVIVFAILGVCLGAFTFWLPREWKLLPKILPLLVAVPLVFMTGYAVRYHLWIQEVAAQSELLPAQAQQITDTLMYDATGQRGLFGFFNYTVQVPILPTDLRSLQTVDEDDKFFRSELTRFSGLEPGLFSMIFTVTGWGIRTFYTLLAAITALIYFVKGLVWANNARQLQR